MTLTVFVALAVLLELGAGTGLAAVVGLSRIRQVLTQFDWAWLPVPCASLGLAFVGYYFAYRGVFTVENGPRLSRAQLRAAVGAGFGGFLAHAGGNLDKYALEAAGASEVDARTRVMALAGLEYGVLSIGGSGAAIAMLVAGAHVPLSFTVPWAVLPLPGFLAGFWAAERYRDRFPPGPGWRGLLGSLLMSVHLIRVLFTQPSRWGYAWLGMAVFWAMEAFTVWAALAAFGYWVNGADLFVGFATGTVFTRRTGPLAGAGVLTAALPAAIWCCGAPFAVAVAGVFAYRVLAFWLPMPFSLAALPTLRRMNAATQQEGAGTRVTSLRWPLPFPWPLRRRQVGGLPAASPESAGSRALLGLTSAY